MKKTYYFFFTFVVFVNLLIFSQNFEYRLEESNIISWNGINVFDAGQLGAGDISFFASDPFSGISNPALISVKKTSSFGFNFSAVSFDSFQYKGINEGVKTTGSPLTGRYTNINSIAASFRLSVFKINLGWYVSDILKFPSFEFRNEYSNNQYDYYKGIFEGKKNNFFSAISFDLNKKLTLGIKLGYIIGDRDFKITQHTSYNYIINGQDIIINKYTESVEKNKINQLIPTLGFSYKIRSNLLLSMAFVYPIKGRVKREIRRSFVNETQNINITNTENVSDPYFSPKTMFFGIKKEFNFKNKDQDKKKKLIFAFESKIILWSNYKYVFFGENIQRDLKNSIVSGIGLEYGIYSKQTDIFLRAGFKLDPQPVKTINTVLKVLNGGFGFRIGRLSGNIGAAYWFGDCGGIDRQNIIISSGIYYEFGRKK